jgi:SulP family sulfate permease
MADLAAGLTVGVVLIPQGMAYALIAGLPPVYGLYAAVVPMALYALLGTSRHMSVGPVAMAALLVANGVAPLAQGDAARYVTLAIMLTLLVGVIQLGMGLLRAGFLVNLLSHPVLAGFTSAAAIMIATSQLGGLTGLAISRGHVHEMLIELAGTWSATHLLTLSIGGAALAAGIGVRRIFPKLPVPMIIVLLGTLGSWFFGFGERGVQIVGAVPSGLPSFALPGFSMLGLPGMESSLGLPDVKALIPVAIAIALVGFMESIAVAKVYASRYRYDIDADQELKALGIANIAGGFFQSFPATGGFSRTAVNVDSGARSQVAALVSAGVIAVTLLFLTPLFHHLPKAILSAIIIVAVLGLIDVQEARKLWHVDRRDFGLMIATFLATLLFGIEEGILIGAGLSIAVLLQQIARPRISVLGRVPGTDQYRSVLNRPDAIVEPGVAVLRMDASLFYGNAEAFRDAARKSFADALSSPRTALVIDCYPMNRTDSTGLHMLHEILYEVRSQGGRIYLSGVKEPLDDKLLAGGIRDLIGPERYFPELRPAVDAAVKWVGAADPTEPVRTPAAS